MVQKKTEIQNIAGISNEALKDVRSIVGGLYSLNARYAIGYGFDLNAQGNEILVGMFIDSPTEIPEYAYYLEFKTGILTRN